MYLTHDLRICSVAHENMLQQFWGKNTVTGICYQTAECLILLCYQSCVQLEAVNTMLASVQKHIVTSFQEYN